MLRYAKAGEIHDGVHPNDLLILDENNERQTHVIEANAEEGWLIRYVLKDGKIVLKDGEALTERVNMKFTIVKNLIE